MAAIGSVETGGGLTRDAMVLNDGKQQVLGLTLEVRRAWERIETVATVVAKDLGLSDSGFAAGLPEMEAKLAKPHRQAHSTHAVYDYKHRARREMFVRGGVPLHHATPDCPNAPDYVQGDTRRGRATPRRSAAVGDDEAVTREAVLRKLTMKH